MKTIFGSLGSSCTQSRVLTYTSKQSTQHHPAVQLPNTIQHRQLAIHFVSESHKTNAFSLRNFLGSSVEIVLNLIYSSREHHVVGWPATQKEREQKGPHLALYKVSLTLLTPWDTWWRKVVVRGWEELENIQSHLGGTWKVYFLDILQMCQKVPSFFSEVHVAHLLLLTHTSTHINILVWFHSNDEFPLLHDVHM